MRLLAGIAMLAASVWAPASPIVRVAVFGGIGVSLLATAAIGSCMVYSLLGRSTCPSEDRR